jgi:hypothetical protein
MNTFWPSRTMALVWSADPEEPQKTIFIKRISTVLKSS